MRYRPQVLKMRLRLNLAQTASKKKQFVKFYDSNNWYKSGFSIP
jgi:hypothetical protein